MAIAPSSTYGTIDRLDITPLRKLHKLIIFAPIKSVEAKMLPYRHSTRKSRIMLLHEKNHSST
jgi:hypothetical protein